MSEQVVRMPTQVVSLVSAFSSGGSEESTRGFIDIFVRFIGKGSNLESETCKCL